MILHEALSEQVIAAAIEVHRELGPGLLESAYKKCLCHELSLRQVEYRPEVSLPVYYKGISLDCGYRMDLVVEDKIVLELKTVETIQTVHGAQLLTYLRLSGIRVGLLMNFNASSLRQGLVRRVL